MEDKRAKELLRMLAGLDTAQRTELIARLMASLDSFGRAKLDAILRSQGTGIKKNKFEEVLSPESVSQEGKISEVEETTRLDEYGAVAREIFSKIKVYDCGHPVERGITEGEKFEKAKNFGGICQIPGCGRTFCNKMSGNKPLCYRRCNACKRMLCMKHAKSFDQTGEIYCGLLCYIKKRLGLAK